jgi:hypothetical protein
MAIIGVCTASGELFCQVKGPDINVQDTVEPFRLLTTPHVSLEP